MKLTAFLLVFLSITSLAGEITGVVKWDGNAPKMKPLKMDADPVCSAAYSGGEMARAETLVLGEGNTMAHIFVRISKGLPDKKWPTPSEPAEMDQKGCMYSPHVVGVMVDQDFKFVNSDDTLHNVNVKATVNRGFNLGMPTSMRESMQKFSREELMIEVKCNVHPWMKSYIGVSSHPFFAVTGEDGKYTISGLDAGTYEVEVWHEKLGTQTQSVTIGQDESKSLDFSFSMPSK
ncbi:MAG: carboxypeptidase regulatory-like domain-containing protein [Acidobacteria bacterium]|nr:carboxypeptidase regulatory-like domain-containing protein [Acidobacteriota bacterium]